MPLLARCDDAVQKEVDTLKKNRDWVVRRRGEEIEAALLAQGQGKGMQAERDPASQPQAIVAEVLQQPAPLPVAPVPESPPVAAPDRKVLCERLIAALRRRGALPDGHPTLGEIARHADTVLGRTDVSRFIFEFYYPLEYGESTNAEAAQFAQDLVRQLEQS